MKYENYEQVEKIMDQIEDHEERLEALEDSTKVKVEVEGVYFDAKDGMCNKLILDFIFSLKTHYSNEVKRLKEELEQL